MPSTQPEKKKGGSSDGGTSKRRKILMISGQALFFIFKEESLIKCFLTITTFCEMIIGSSLSPNQQQDLVRAAKHFNIDGSNQFTLSLISSAQEQQLMNYADVSIVLNTKYQKMSTIQIKADIVMTDLYPLIYIIFQHGSVCHRRINAATQMMLYRCFFLLCVIIFYMSFHCYSPSMPAKSLMLIMFNVLISPV